MKKRRGFTLIEMAIGMSLVLVMTGVVIGRYRVYSRTQAARMAAARLEQVINEAKTNALAGKKDCVACGGADGTCNGVGDLTLVGWRVGINIGGATNGYVINGNCAGTDFWIRTENFPPNVTISLNTALSADEVLYRPLGGGVIMRRGGAVVNTAMEVNVSVDGVGVMRVTVRNDGDVQITPL